MSGVLINLIIQIISGAVGGNVAAGAAKNIDLGTLGNTIAGAIGGGAAVTHWMPLPDPPKVSHGAAKALDRFMAENGLGPDDMAIDGADGG